MQQDPLPPPPPKKKKQQNIRIEKRYLGAKDLRAVILVPQVIYDWLTRDYTL